MIMSHASLPFIVIESAVRPLPSPRFHEHIHESSDDQDK